MNAPTLLVLLLVLAAVAAACAHVLRERGEGRRSCGSCQLKGLCGRKRRNGSGPAQ